MATWLDYAHQLQLRFIRYDAQTKRFYFWDPDNLSKQIVEGYLAVDPTVSLHKFESSRARLLSIRADAIKEEQRKRQVRRG